MLILYLQNLIISNWLWNPGVNIFHENWNCSGTDSENFKTFPLNQITGLDKLHTVIFHGFRRFCSWPLKTFPNNRLIPKLFRHRCARKYLPLIKCQILVAFKWDQPELLLFGRKQNKKYKIRRCISFLLLYEKNVLCLHYF